MRWSELLGERAFRVRTVIAHAYDARYKEGRIFERVRLFDGAQQARRWWRRAAARLAHRVLEESREHEITARQAALETQDAAFIETATLLSDYQAALAALEAIAGNADDPMEVAARAIDAAEARMARFADAKVARLSLSLDAKGAMDGIQQAKDAVVGVQRLREQPRACDQAITAPKDHPSRVEWAQYLVPDDMGERMVEFALPNGTVYALARAEWDECCPTHRLWIGGRDRGVMHEWRRATDA
jgi:hypothetical protein